MSERCQGEKSAVRADAKTRAGRRAEPTDGALASGTSGGAASPKGRAAIKKSRVGPWRAGVLIGVHLLIAGHFLHWWSTGESMTPLEPSEAMEFSTKSVINAGFVLFVIGIGSTAILGRWFCGWGCHIVALQDLCRWMLGKIGLVPRLVDLGPLRVVPWLAFVYMFLAPLLDRALAGMPLGTTGTHFMTDELWRTFPKTWVEAVATLFVCGFLIVWLLGSKGFCTYGCPYGGIFGVADQLAPVRIRVTDACEGCGHCTAVCTSNVNVAREVREFGMVVDPGCMKCLDCVSVCPNDALYVGFGVPALLAKKQAKAVASKFDWGRLVLGAVFAYGALAVFLWHDGVVNLRFTVITWVLAFAVILVFRGRSRPKAEHTLPEEVLMSALFLGSMAAFRGLHDSVPFLFALGISAIGAWWGVQLVRLAFAPDVRLQRTLLKRAGRWTLAGGVFAVATLPIGWLGVRGALEQREERAARTAAQEETHARRQLAINEYNRGVEAAQSGRIDDAIAAFRSALQADEDFQAARENLAGALCMTGRLEEGLAEFDIALAQNPMDADTLALSAQALAELNRFGEARDRLARAVEILPDRAELWRMLGDLQESAGDASAAAASRERASAIERGTKRP